MSSLCKCRMGAWGAGRKMTDQEETPPCKVCGGYVSQDRCFKFQGEVMGYCPKCEVMIGEMIETLGSVMGNQD